MLNKEEIKNTFYTSLVLLFTISSLFRTGYSAYIPVDFGGYFNDIEIALVINPNTPKSVPVITTPSDLSKFNDNNSQRVNPSGSHGLFKLKINRYIFPQFVSTKYLHSEFSQSIQIIKKINIFHKSPDDIDPFII